MQAKLLRSVVALALSSSIAACATGGRAPSLLPAVPAAERAASAVPHANVAYAVVVVVPSPVKAGSIAISLVQAQIGTVFNGYAALSKTTNANCHGAPLICGVKFSVPADSFTAAFGVYAGPLKNGKPSGALLAANRGLSITVNATHTSVRVALGGTPKSVYFVPSVSMVLRKTGAYGMSKCFTPQDVSVFAVDAGGDIILGAGAPKPGIVSNIAAVGVATPSPTVANTFALKREGIPAGNSTGTVTTSVTSGATKVTKVVTLGFDGTICGVVTEFPIHTASSAPTSIVEGPDGNLWFTESCGYHITKITTAGTMTEYATKSGYASTFITVGSDKALYYTESNPPTNGTDYVGRMTTSGTHTDYQTAGSFTGIAGIASGSDGKLWIAEQSGNYIDTITTALTGFTQYGSSQGMPSNAEPLAATAGADGNTWFTLTGVNKIAKVTTDGTITPYSSGITGTTLHGVALGPDGNVWFSENGTNQIGKITPSGAITEYGNGGAGKTITPSAFVNDIVAGPDGAIWFTENNVDKIGRITTDGSSVTEYSTGITTGASPTGIALGADGSLWFTECGTDKIGRLQ